jgi:excisionase family DNA binding protein
MKRITAPAKPGPLRADEIMTVSALARYLDCSPSLIYHRLLKKKQIPAFKLGGTWRFSRSDIDEWIARLHDTTNPPLTRGPKPKLSYRRAGMKPHHAAPHPLWSV